MKCAVRVDHAKIDYTSVCTFRRVGEAVQVDGDNVYSLRKIAPRDVSLGEALELFPPPQPDVANIRGYGVIPVDFEFP